MKLLIKTTGVERFYRCGRKWTKEGVVVDATDLEEEDAKRLAREPNLHISEISEEDAAKLGASANTDVDDEALAAQVGEIIQLLEADDFDKSGNPKLNAVRKNLSDGVDAKRVNRSLVQAQLTLAMEAGFEVPQNAPAE